MRTELIVAPVVVAMTAVSIPVPVMGSIMVAVVLIETVTIILVKLPPAPASDAVVIIDMAEMLWFRPFPAEPVLESRVGGGCRTFAARSAAPPAFRLRRDSGMVFGG